MSKVGQYNLELQEQAEELGFSTTQEALDAGFTVDYTAKEPTLVFDNDKAQEQAHEAWLKEKEEVLKGLDACLETSECSPACDIDIERAIKFIEGVSHE